MTGMIRRGKAWKCGDRIGIESISPLRFMLDPPERAWRCLESVDPLFGPNVKPGDILFAGKTSDMSPATTTRFWPSRRQVSAA
ncbi:3-isopropylmalate dehydratase, small subunit [Paraburkholderia xenovorans LB400]|uniref:hypothetical protein n=1 Tax=Paraburkholderia xenovorans TaxID=36873 RepID=UPI0004F74806|nr:hypothetical protein [Paraburkholderia xenovorans]AIP33898.1 3-isopropylmalate dehydratase, small subunit [Paraburkholderia xenovorans LB400]